MLDGVVRFPPEFAARYREKGYWEDRSLASVWDEACVRYADHERDLGADDHQAVTDNAAGAHCPHGDQEAAIWQTFGQGWRAHTGST